MSLFLPLRLSGCRATPSGAIVAELPSEVTAAEIFAALAAAPHRIFLDSAILDGEAVDGANSSAPRLGRFSFVACDPVHSLVVTAPEPWSTAAAATAVREAFDGLRGLLADLATPTIPGLPPFQGGIAGLVGYEAGLALLDVAPPPQADIPVPLLSLHLYDVVFAFDHDARQGWVISQGIPAKGPVARGARAADRIDAILARLDDSRRPPRAPLPPGPLHDGGGHPLPGHAGVGSTHTPEGYRDMVERGIEFVRAGDIFQVNLAQRLAVAGEIDPTLLHLRAREINPAPFAASFDAGPVRITSMSPERLLSVSRRVARMHPIKGTRRVIASPEADLFAGDDLEESAKDRAENVMIVDLVRNDLSRVCTPESVRVEALCRRERYATVQHLVSIVTGRLRPRFGPLDALLAALPGGSVTGAPKHRACEIISAVEPVARGAYCGSIGYLGLDSSADFNLLIRTLVAGNGRTTFSAGGGITASSLPDAEHAESLHKAEGMLRVLSSLDRDAVGGGDR
jgi:para-aminobenzoate synthetase component 1